MDFNGHKIHFELRNGVVYVDATETAKPYGKKPGDFIKTAQTKEYITALSTASNILEADLVQTKNGGDGFGTWLHHKLALRFAGWLDVRLQIWMDEQIENLLRGETPAPVQPIAIQETPESRIRVLNMGLDLLDRLGGCDDAFKRILQDQTKNILAGPKLLTAGEGKRAIWPISDRVLFLGYKNTNQGTMTTIGKRMIESYRVKNKRDPVKREQFVNGTTRMVYSYGYEDLEIMDAVIHGYFKKEISA
jgi:hypothetical protein